jgi:SAM-dependent methyltransferase
MGTDANEGLWDSFWAVHASSNDLFHQLLWRIRFLFSSAYAYWMAQSTGKLKSVRLLEVGCGSARTLHYLDQIYDKSKCYALDLSPKAIDVVRQISPDFYTGVASAIELPLAKDTFEVSFSIGLIEHFTREMAAQMVSEKIRVTRPGGLVGIVVPWESSVYNLILRKAFGKHWPFGEENPFHRRELTLFMEKLGLRDVKIHVIYGSTLLGIGRK